jgi:succinyl-diaminopimelate desuccinylase
MNAVLDLARELVARPSITPEDGGCQRLIAGRLAPLGFRLETFEGGGVTNAWLRRGTARPLVVLAGHTDVVPPGPRERWLSDPFVPEIRDGRLHGRGAADMKGSLAAFVVAVERFVAAHPDHPGSIALLLTSDEEGPATHGTVMVTEALRARGEAIDACLVGEPTSTERLGDTVKNGRRGSLGGRLVARGVQGHVAYPHLAKNPVHALAPALADLAAERWDEGNAHFPPTTFQVSNIAAGTGALNVIPGECTVDFNFRYSTASTVDDLSSRVEAILARHGVEGTVAWHHAARPYLTERGPLLDAVAAAVREVTGETPAVSTTGGTSDGRFVAETCAQVVEFGPVNRSIHKVNEAVDVAELEPLAAIYRRTLELFLLPR